MFFFCIFSLELISPFFSFFSLPCFFFSFCVLERFHVRLRVLIVYSSQLISEQLLSETDFIPGRSGAHPLTEWYGIRRFLVIRPVRDFMDASEVSMVLGAVAVACAAAKFSVPCFACEGDPHLRLYLGLCSGGDAYVRFRFAAALI